MNTNRKSVLVTMADRYGMEPAAFEATLRSTVFPAKGSKEQFAAFLLVAKEYDLNPVTKEIYAFPTKDGGVQPIISIDGWMNIINSHPLFDGMEFEDHMDKDGNIESITCKIYRKDREHPTSVTEYMEECYRDTITWKKWPARMLRHKAAIQCARYSFGFSGIIEPDEFERGEYSREIKNLTPPPPSGGSVPADQTADELALAEGIVSTPMHPPSPIDVVDIDTVIDDICDRLKGAATDQDRASFDDVVAEFEARKESMFPPDQDLILDVIDNLMESFDASVVAEKGE